MKKIVWLMICLLLLVACSKEETVQLDSQDIEQPADCAALDGKSEKDLKTLSNMLKGEKADKLKDRLNRQVLISKDAVKKEIGLARRHTCYNDDRRDDPLKWHLRMYALMLEYDYALMQSEDKLMVDRIEFKKMKDNLEYRLISILEDGKEINVAYLAAETDVLRSYIFNEDNSVRLSEPPSVLPFQSELERKDIFKRTLSLLIDPVTRVSKELANGQYMQNAQERIRLITKEFPAAIYLNLEIATIEVNSNHFLYGDENKLKKIALYPTWETDEIFKRLKEAHRLNPEIPYPEALVAKQDWPAIEESFRKMGWSTAFRKYILSNYLSDWYRASDLIEVWDQDNPDPLRR